MKFALIMSMGLFIASCNAAESSKEGEAGHIVMIPGQTLATKLENVSVFLKLGACDNAASLYDRELASANLESDAKIKLLTMIAGKYFESNRDDEGKKYAAQAAEIHNEPFLKSVALIATSTFRQLDMQRKQAGLITENDKLD